MYNDKHDRPVGLHWPWVIHEGEAEGDEEQVEEVVVAGGHDGQHQEDLVG